MAKPVPAAPVEAAEPANAAFAFMAKPIEEETPAANAFSFMTTAPVEAMPEAVTSEEVVQA